MDVVTGATVAAVVVAGALASSQLRRLRALAWAGRLPRRLGALPQEEVASHDAPRGWKCAQLLVADEEGSDDVVLAGVAIGGTYRVEDTAVCVLGHRHAPPALDCECGFYAHLRREDAVDLLARRLGLGDEVVIRALLEVELRGTVVECERGYRAGEQHVLGIGLLPWCGVCAGQGQLVRAVTLGPEPRREPLRLLFGHGALAESAAPRLHPSVEQRRRLTALQPLCAGCRGTTGLPTLDLAAVAGALGTEVTWLDASLVAGDRVTSAHQPHPRL